MDNSPSGVSGDPYVALGQHGRRYLLDSRCASEGNCRLVVETFDSESGARLGSATFRWNGNAFVFRGTPRSYGRSGGTTCETSSGELIEDAYTVGEEIRIAPPSNDGLIVEMSGIKSISGTVTAIGDAAGCEPFEMTYDVHMSGPSS